MLPVGSVAPNAYQLELTLGGMVVVPSDQVPGAITALVAGTGAPNAMRSTVAGPGLGSVPTERRVCVVALINDDIGQPYVGGDVDVRGQLLHDGGTVRGQRDQRRVAWRRLVRALLSCGTCTLIGDPDLGFQLIAFYRPADTRCR